MLVRELSLSEGIDQGSIRRCRCWRQGHDLVSPIEVGAGRRVDGLFGLPRLAAVGRAGEHRLRAVPLEGGCVVEASPGRVDEVRVGRVGRNGWLVVIDWTPAISRVAWRID